jgi:glyoxalase family protein
VPLWFLHLNPKSENFEISKLQHPAILIPAIILGIKNFNMQNRVLGLHHITAIANNAKSNYDFYTRVLGLRLVKKTVNFDDPGTYHFYYGDEIGTPGTILTFFPWEGIGQGNNGSGMATNIGFSVPGGSFNFWIERFAQFNIPVVGEGERFGESFLAFRDPDGLNLQFINPANPDNREGWHTGEVDKNVAAKGFHSISLTLNKIEATAKILTDILGYYFLKQEGNIHRFITGAVENASIVDLIESPGMPPGRSAAGTNHHVAFRVKDDDILMEFRAKVAAAGLSITPKIDRDYFFSLYFREPGGVLFELASDNPGFTRDEVISELGNGLKLPKQFEAFRSQIEATLPALTD